MKKYKLFVLGLLTFVASMPFVGVFAQEYIFFYGNGCQHCAKVEKFFDDNEVTEKFDIEFKEVYFDRDNIKDFMSYITKLGLDSSQVGVPFLVINS